MKAEEIEQLYPEFDKWWRREMGYLTVDGIWLIKLWYEFLQRIGYGYQDYYSSRAKRQGTV